MSRNEHKRVKHGQKPGDISKSVKIAMREKETPLVVHRGQIIGSSAAKAYRNVLKRKGRKVQRRRDKIRIEESRGKG